MPHNMEAITVRGPGNWRTPPSLADQIIDRYSIDYDAFADHDNHIVPFYSTEDGTYETVLDGNEGLVTRKVSDEDGINFSWEGRSVLLNPPYTAGFIPKVVGKCIAERNRARIIVALLSADTSTIAWRNIIMPNAESITYLPRIKFWLPDGSGPGGSPNFGSAIVVFKKDWKINDNTKRIKEKQDV